MRSAAVVHRALKRAPGKRNARRHRRPSANQIVELAAKHTQPGWPVQAGFDHVMILVVQPRASYVTLDDRLNVEIEQRDGLS
jgi:hypothetical protein